MKYDQLIQLYFERSTSLQGFWTLYVVVIGGLLAISNLRTRRDRPTVVLVTILFSCFAYKNLGAIHDVNQQRNAAMQTIMQYDGVDADKRARELLEPTLVQASYDGIKTFHVSCDVLTILMLWAMERRRIRYAKSEGERV